jgi:putative membrane protein
VFLSFNIILSQLYLRENFAVADSSGVGYAPAMITILVEWLIFAAALLIVAHLVPGFELKSFGAALWAALVIGLMNILFGWLIAILHILTFPLTVLTLGIFWFVVNGLFLYIASWFVPGFRIRNLLSATLAAAILSLMHFLLMRLHVMQR